ncbi:MAG TPA: NAD-dependent epimerase/dehydratase family protein [Bacteroidales bacterium]|nr:NAD-dependent epimerase/dehydratase family protein [Bacteroidales bacterium]
MKVLVTGANGFLASNIIRELLRRKIKVRGMLRENCNKKSLEGLSIEYSSGNIVNYSDVLSASSGCDVIIHAAADTSQMHSDPLPLFPVNVNGTQNVIKAAKACNVRRLIFISTANTIGISGENAPGKKDLSAYYKSSGYALSKLKAEQIILNEVNASNLDAVIVNPTFMIGPYDSRPGSGRIIIHFLKNKIAFYPSGGKNFVDVRCAAAAICNAIEHGRSGERYILSGVNMTYREFMHLLNKVAKAKSFGIPIPSSVLIFAGVIGSFLRLIGLEAELNYYNARILTMPENITDEKAVNELQMPESDIAEAIEAAVSWFRKNGYIR